MTLRTVAVPNPPAGEDWQTIVPGQYLYDITNITATLNTGTGTPTVMPDSSGHGFDGTWNAGVGAPTLVPGLVSGDTATYSGRSGPPEVTTSGSASGTMLDTNADFTIEFWLQMDTGYNTAGKAIQFGNAFPTSPVEVYVDNFGNVQGARVGSTQAQVYDFDASAIITDGAPHYYVVTFTASAIRLFIDGSEVTPFSTSALIGTVLPMPYIQINDPNFDRGLGAIFDEVAIYPTELSGGQISGHFTAAGVSFAAYSAAVIADMPAGYWHLDGGLNTGRQVALRITDGMFEVDLIPTGFPDVSTPGPYAYNWAPNLQASAQTPNGAVTTVAIPQLVLPAGYTIGTDTIDIEGGDQWSAITVWWSDDVMDSLNPINPYAYPPGATLVPRYLGSQP